jgi:nitrogen fixation/metabolism regulation signal transduction histidine kinase
VEPPALLLAVEGLLLLSAFTGVHLVHRLFAPLRLVQESAQLLQENDFTTRFRPFGQPEVDALVDVYNRMADTLRAERVRVQEQHHFLERLVQASPTGTVILDLDGLVTLVNPAAARLLQATPQELAGRPLRGLASPLVDALVALPAGASAVVPLWGGERVRCQHGTFIDRGFPRSFYTIEELTEELRRHERAAYEKLIRMLSHEVNNSVTAAHSLLESCLTYAPQLRSEDRGDFEHALAVVMGRMTQLSAFMGSFADVVRLPPPRREPCDLVEMAAGVLRLLGPLAEARGIGWRWDVQEPLSAVSVDRAQMEQVLVNVVKNALEAIGSNGTVIVRTLRRDGREALVVEDSGAGIAPDARPHLFTAVLQHQGARTGHPASLSSRRCWPSTTVPSRSKGPRAVPRASPSSSEQG